MASKLVMSVTLEDGTHYPDVPILPGDMVRFEQHFGVSFGALGDLTVTQIAFLAWSPLHRKGLTGLNFEAFCDALGDIPEVQDHGDAVPTDPAP